MSRETIFDEIAVERAYQSAKWGNLNDDTCNLPNDWVAILAHYSTKWLRGEVGPYSPECVADFRRCMIKCAAIATAAAESLDRQVGLNGKPFYQR